MRFVPMKTAEQQAALMLVGLRDRLIRNRTQLSNAIRGYATEFGFAAAKGMVHLDPLFAFERMRVSPTWLASYSWPWLRNTHSYRRKSAKSTPSSWPDTRPMNAADASPRSPASVQSARLF
jgi:hypothetical protein